MIDELNRKSGTDIFLRPPCVILLKLGNSESPLSFSSEELSPTGLYGGMGGGGGGGLCWEGGG